MKASSLHPQTICDNCQKNNESGFVRCVRCGRLRRDINKDILFGRLMLIVGLPAAFISAFLIYKFRFDDTFDLTVSSGVFHVDNIATIACIASVLLFIGGLRFIHRAEYKKDAEL